MPIGPRARKAGIFSSSDVALLGRVFDKLKDDDQSLGVREALASWLLKLPLGVRLTRTQAPGMPVHFLGRPAPFLPLGWEIA